MSGKAAAKKPQPTLSSAQSGQKDPRPLSEKSFKNRAVKKITNFLKEQGYCKEFHYQTTSAKEFCSIFNARTQCIHFSRTCITAAIKKIVAVCSSQTSERIGRRECREQCGMAAAPKSQPTLSSAQSHHKDPRLTPPTLCARPQVPGLTVNVPNFQRPLTTEEMATGPSKQKEKELRVKLNCRGV